MFRTYFEEFYKVLDKFPGWKERKEYPYGGEPSWNYKKSNLVMEYETAVELGGPKEESVSFLLWKDHSKEDKLSGTVLLGPDISDSFEKKIPFGKVILVTGEGFNEDNAYERYEEMNKLRYRLDMEGYMLRAIPQNNKEWSRISYGSYQKGLSFELIGNRIISQFLKLPYVESVNVYFITSSIKDVQALKPLGSKAAISIQAMQHIVEHLEYDCNACGFQEVCKEVDGLKAMHKNKASSNA